jgi:hypothetical protein
MKQPTRYEVANAIDRLPKNQIKNLGIIFLFIPSLTLSAHFPAIRTGNAFPLSVNLIMTADVNWYDLMAQDDQLQGDPVTDVD